MRRFKNSFLVILEIIKRWTNEKYTNFIFWFFEGNSFTNKISELQFKKKIAIVLEHGTFVSKMQCMYNTPNITVVFNKTLL
jgi:hypothetical protein